MKHGDMVNLNEASGKDPWKVPALIINGPYAALFHNDAGKIPHTHETKVVDVLCGTRIHKKIPVDWLEKF
tara:strand:+ start:919 stop:1128 length:210 start_codon:yes stop_codon:yes gene_type:complete